MVVIEEISEDNDEAPTVLEDGTRVADAERKKQESQARKEAEAKAAAAQAEAEEIAAREKVTAAKKAASKLQEPNVFINIYDITPCLNKWIRCCCPSWGIYHTGVEVYGREFAFGGHDKGTTGVFCAKPKAVKGATFRKQVPVGYTDLDARALRQHIATLATEWSGNSYDLFKRNCNNFSDFLCGDLTGENVPRYVNRCARSSFVRCFFSACVKPVARCLERSGLVKTVSYADDDDANSQEADADFCIHGARGMNQVLVEAATAQKEEANTYFRAGAYDQAARMYMQALGLIQALSRLEEDSEYDLAVMKQASDVCKALLLNIAFCNLKAEDWDRTVHCCDTVLEMDPNSAKAYFRRGIANFKLLNLRESLQDLEKALSLTDPSDETTCQHIKTELTRVRRERCGD